MKREVIEYTCDVCDCEVDESILIPKVINLIDSIKVYLTVDDDICIYCLIKAVNKLDTRTKAANNE